METIEQSNKKIRKLNIEKEQIKDASNNRDKESPNSLKAPILKQKSNHSPDINTNKFDSTLSQGKLKEKIL